MLQDYDKTVPDLTGYWTEIGYGDTYSGTDYYELTARIWVKHQRSVTMVGKQYMMLECAGIWEVFAEQQLLYGDPPLYEAIDEETGYPLFDGDFTVYSIIVNILGKFVIQVNDSSFPSIAGVMNITLPSPDDGIINTYKPIFFLGGEGQDKAILPAIQWLMSMTKCVIRVKPSNAMEIIYPQDTDSTDETYYPDQYPYYYEFVDRENVTTPNRVICWGKVNYLEDWSLANAVSGTAEIDTAQRNKYMDVYEVIWRPNISNAADLTTQAQVQLAQNVNNEITGSLTIPHDARVELYDFVGIVIR